MKNLSLAVPILPFQAALSPALPTVSGNLDYPDFECPLRRIDALVIGSALEMSVLE